MLIEADNTLRFAASTRIATLWRVPKVKSSESQSNDSGLNFEARHWVAGTTTRKLARMNRVICGIDAIFDDRCFNNASRQNDAPTL